MDRDNTLDGFNREVYAAEERFRLAITRLEKQEARTQFELALEERDKRLRIVFPMMVRFITELSETENSYAPWAKEIVEKINGTPCKNTTESRGTRE